MLNHPIFEDSTSTLYYSNDGRLHVEPYAGGFIILDAGVGDSQTGEVNESPIVFATKDRVKADAYIAGYDLATSQHNEALDWN